MSNTLHHMGYVGSVEYSAVDRLFHGRVSGIRDSVSFEGRSVDELEQNFRSAVDEYLEFCKAEGKQPDQPYKGSFNVRVSSELHKRAALYAEEHHTKLNKVVAAALDKFLVEA